MADIAHVPLPGRLRRAEIASVLAMVVFAIGLFGAALWGGGRQSWETLQHVPLDLLPVLLALSLVNYLMRGLRWLLFSRALGLNVPPMRNALYYVAGFSMTATPGKLGEALRLWLLRRYHGCALERSAPLLVADRLTDGVATSTVVALTVGWFASYRLIAFGAVAGVFALTLALLRPVLLVWALDVTFHLIRRAPRLFVRARRAARGLQAIGAPGVLALAVVFGLIGWCAEGLSFALLLHALGVTLATPAAIFVFCFAMLVGALSFLPGGLGSTEATMVGLLVTQGVPVSTAVVATGVVRVTTLWFAICLGLVALPVALRRPVVA